MRLDKLFLPLMASLLLSLPAHAEEEAAKDVKPPPEREAVQITPEDAKAAPAISFVDALGKPQTLDPKAAKLTLVHLWATWCVPCLKELPALDKLTEAYHEKGLHVVPLALDGANMQKVHDFYNAQKITYLPANDDKDNTSLRALHGTALPLSVFINAKGEEIARAEGPVDWEAEKTRKFLDGALK